MKIKIRKISIIELETKVSRYINNFFCKTPQIMHCYCVQFRLMTQNWKMKPSWSDNDRQTEIGNI